MKLIRISRKEERERERERERNAIKIIV